jgi:hypothetical protein
LAFVAVGTIATLHAQAVFQEMEGIVLLGFGLLITSVMIAGSRIVDALDQTRAELRVPKRDTKTDE